MTTEYLGPGAKTFAPPAWGDGAGGSGSGLANGNDYIVDSGFGPITAGLDQSALTGIASMYFTKNSDGIVGGGSVGSFLIDADVDANSYIANYGKVTLYLAAAGVSGVISNFSCGPGSVNYLTAGSFAELDLDGGTTSINEATVISGTARINGGLNTIMYNATNATKFQINGGVTTIKRAPTTLEINGGTVIFDPDEEEEYTSKTLTLNAGTLILKAGSYPTVNLNGGTLDLSQNKRALVLGATAGVSNSACRIIRHSNADISNITPNGSSKVDVGIGPIPL